MSDEDYYINALFLDYILGKNSDKDELLCIPEYLTKLGWIHKTELEKNGQWDKARIAQLEQENVKLKSEIKALQKSYKWHMARIWEQEQTIEYQRKENVSWEEQYRSLATENAKLRDAMYVNAGKYALQHMDEDELRIWATQQSEYIEELKELCKDMWHDIPKTESCGWDADANCCTGSDECAGECGYWYRMRELGIEVGE